MTAPRPPLELNEVDRRIWAEELEGFVPQRVFDVHTHVYRWSFNTDPDRETGTRAELIGRTFPESSRAMLAACDAALMPGRRVHRLSFGFPFWPACDFEASNNWAATEAGGDRGSAALMLVHPAMTPQYLESQIASHGFVGLKPYRFYSRTDDAVQCRITDFLPEEQIAVANARGLILMLHLAKRDAVADSENIDELLRLTTAYPRAKWILAHCARSYSAWPIERALDRLAGLPNVWYDTSSVCESDAIEALLAGAGPERVMYGSDDVPVGVSRGKYITFGYAWAFLSEKNHSLDLSHCSPGMTFVRYEQLRAMRRAALRMRLTREQIEDLFHNTAAGLVQSAQRSYANPLSHLDGEVTW